ncbi:MAG: hypothetical protein IKL70_06065 [Oscillospiraceae bacterium]|nr:hypothetical protein [Oscillospiraceae bacterium]
MSSTYKLCKKVIEKGKQKGTLNIEEMTEKLDVFLLNDRISDEEYNELMALMTA